MALKKMTVALAMIAGLGVVAGGALAQTAVADAVKARHEHFKQQGAAFKAINDELKKDSPSLGVITPNALKIKATAAELPNWFPKGSGPESSLRPMRSRKSGATRPVSRPPPRSCRLKPPSSRRSHRPTTWLASRPKPR